VAQLHAPPPLLVTLSELGTFVQSSAQVTELLVALKVYLGRQPQVFPERVILFEFGMRLQLMVQVLLAGVQMYTAKMHRHALCEPV